MLSSAFLISSTFFLGSIPSLVSSSFTYEFSAPGSCDDLDVSWTGGQPPFQLVLVPVFGTPRTFQIPNSAVTNGQGHYSAQVNFPPNQKIFLVMSDATGFGSGGTSLITQVGPSLSGMSCNTTDPGVDFFFNLDTALTQCRAYVFDGYDQAVQPVTITGYIPGGNTFQVHPPTGPTTFNWQANLEAGTTVIFAMTDSKGHNGGSSDLKLVGASGDNSCLNPGYPTSTSSPPTQTSSSTGPSSSPPPQNDTKGGGPSTVTLALASLGGVIILAVIAALFFFYFQRRRERENAYSEGSHTHRRKPGTSRMSLDHEEPRPVDNHSDDQAVSHITPFSESFPAASPGRLQYSLQGAEPAPPPSSNGPSKASQVSSFRQPRFIVHTDVEDAVPEDDNQEVIELPPTYSQREPLPSSTAGSSLYTSYQPPSPLFPHHDAYQ